MMLRKLLKMRPDARRPEATIPAGKRVYAIGDIHGCDALLGQLLDKIDADDSARGSAETTIIALGDLVDRGPASAAVIDRLRNLALVRPGVRLLAGNHEEVFLKAVAGDERAIKMFSRIGGRETLLSYGVDAAAYDRMDYAELEQALADSVPQAHIDFLSSFEDMVTIGDYTFVHAGVRPGTPLDEQHQQDLRWIREGFLNHNQPFEKVIVHGHTIVDQPEFRRNRIGIDTGAYESGRLTSLGLEGNEHWTIEAN